MNRREFLRDTSLAALTVAVPVPSGGAQEQPPGRVLTGHQWRTIAVVHDHLLPSEPGAPGSGDIHATAYLDGVLADPDLDPEIRSLILQGIGWLDDLAQEGNGRAFADLDLGLREDLLRSISQRPTGDRWLSVLLAYTIEALLADPLYDGNPAGIGWVWLDHDPGRPRPTPQTMYGRLGKA